MSDNFKYSIGLWALFDCVVKPKPEHSQRANHSKETITRSQWELEVKTEQPKTRENATDKVAIGFNFESVWLREWHEFSGPITWRRKASPKQSCTSDNCSKMSSAFGSNVYTYCFFLCFFFLFPYRRSIQMYQTLILPLLLADFSCWGSWIQQ